MTDLLFSTPWWLPTAIIVAGVFVFVTANARQISGARNVGAGLVLLAFVLMLVSYLVETDKERVVRQSRELVKSVEQRDWPKMRSLLDPQVSLAIVGASIYNDREQLVQGAQHSVDQHGLKSVVITSLDAERAQSVITVDIDVLSEQDATMGRPVPSSWQFDWEKRGKDWVLDKITCLKIANEQGTQMQGRFVK
jgi:hypothetical protein